MHMQIRGKQTLQNSQQGMAAIIIVMVLMFVISVIVLGFAQIVRREQRNALDNQLATQAYYAAESGLNLAQQKVKAKLAEGLTEQNNCTDESTSGYGITSSDLLIGQNAEITCVLIDPELDTLEYQKIDMNAVPILVKATSGTISDIFVSWELSKEGLQSVAGCVGGDDLVPDSTSRPCEQPILRLDFVPVRGDLDATSAPGRQFTTFLSPRSGTPPTGVNYTAGSVSSIPNVSCRVAKSADSPRTCTARISTLADQQQAYALRIMSIYGQSNVTVFARSGASPVKLIEGQVLIDVTARAADVLKRLQARMPVSGSENVPDFAVTAGGGVCKRYQISGGVPSIDGQSPTSSRFPECNL